MNNFKEREYKVTLFRDRMKIQYNIKNVFKSAKVKNRVLPTKKRDKENPYMTTQQYTKTLKKFKNKLYDLDIQANKSVYITLTTSSISLWNDLKSRFQALILCLKRNFGKIYYIRAIESHDKDNHFHIHMIVMFENEIPTNLNKEWIEKHWKQGFVDYKNVSEPYGIIDYMTTFKSENINPTNDKYTKLPQFVQVISHSVDFPKSEKKEIITTKNEMSEIVDSFKEYCFEETGKQAYVYSDGHKYIDKDTGEIIYCLDRQYLHKPKTNKISS